MAKTFYPFVEGDDNAADQEGLASPTSSARIAVYDSMTMAPRVEIIEPTDIRSYLDEITKTVFELASQQGGDWSFMLIRELVENFIHASFIEPSISILDKGQTLVFSDQGPGIPNKPAALKPSFSSATKAMKRYIRGVGSGLPIVEEQLKMRNGTLTIEDNLGHGTIVTVSLVPGREARHQPQAEPMAANPYQGTPSQPYPAQPGNYGVQQPYPYGNPSVGYPSANAAYGMQQPQPQQAYGYPGAYGYQQQPQPNPGYGMGAPTDPQAQPGYNPYGYGAPMPGYQPYGMPAANVPPGYGAPGYMAPGQDAFGAPNATVPQPISAATAPQPPAIGQERTVPAVTTPHSEEGSLPHATVERARAASDTSIPDHVVLTKEQEDILRLFARSERVGGVDLARELGMANATASRRLVALAKAGHIIKEEGKQKYMLTGEGELVLARLLKSEG